MSGGARRAILADGAPPAALAVARSLVGAGWRVESSDAGFPDRAPRSHGVAGFPTPRPGSDPAGFAEAILRRVAEGPRAVVVPPTDAAILAVLPRRREFERVADLALPPEEALRGALDKERTLAAARGAGVRVPEGSVVRRPEDLDDAPTAGPLVLKPSSSRWTGPDGAVRGAGPSFAVDAAAAREGVRALLAAGAPGVAVQRWVPGVGWGVGLLMRDGAPAAVFVHRRLREVHPAGGPSAAAVSEPPDPAVVDPAVAVLRAIGLEGLAMVEFRREGLGEPVLMEVNPRPWGTLGLAVDAGVDFPRLWLEGHRGPPPEYRADVRRRWLAGDMRRFLAARAGPPSGYPGAFPSAGSALRDVVFGCGRDFVFRWGDPLPFLAEIAGAFR